MDYGCGPSSAPVVVSDICEVNEDDQDCEDEAGDEDGDDESDGDGEVQAYGYVPSFLTINQLMETEQGRYLSVDVSSCDVSHNPNHEDADERGIVNYYLAPSPQFENVENLGNVVSSDWNPWVNYNTTNSSGEFVVGQVFTSKAALQDAIKLYSIKAHQQYVVVASSKN